MARLERLRLADDVVMAYEVSVLPASVLPRPESVGGSLYEHLSHSGHLPMRALQHIRAMNAPALLASQLGVPEGHGGALHHPHRLPRIGPGGRADPFVLPQRLLRFCRRDAARLSTLALK